MRALLSLTLGLVLLAAPAGATVLGIITPEQAGEAATRAAKAAQASAEEKAWTVEQRSGAAASDLARVKVDALLLVMVRPEAQAATVEAARKAGVPVVTVLAGASPQAAFDVTVNQYVAGAQIGAYLLGLADYRGPLVELRADAEPGAKARARVLELMLQEAPDVQSLGSLQRASGDRWQDALKRGLEQKLQQAGSGPLAVWAATDELALAAEQVLKAAGYGRDRVRAGRDGRDGRRLRPAARPGRAAGGHARHPLRASRRGRGRRARRPDRRDARKAGDARPLPLHRAGAGRPQQRPWPGRAALVSGPRQRVG